MKKIKVSLKLVAACFLIVAVLAGLVGTVGIIGMSTIAASGTDIFENQLMPLPHITTVKETLQRIRVYVREMVMSSLQNDYDGVEEAFGVIGDLIPKMTEHLDAYRALITDAEAIAIFERSRHLYENDLTQTVLRIYAASQIGDIPTINNEMNTCRELSNIILDGFHECIDINVRNAEAANQSSLALSRTLLTIIIVLMVIAVGVAVFCALYISGMIGKPLVALSGFLRKASSTGDIIITPEEEAIFSNYIDNKDVIGQMMKDCVSFIDHVSNISKELEEVASGNLTSDISPLSNADTMGKSLGLMVDSLNKMCNEINLATGQVASGSKQISDGAMALAQGTTEQTGTIELLSTSIGKVAENTSRSADLALEAAELSGMVMKNAEKGSVHMEQMMQAVKEINEASASISKVIKAIDDIAFQTNILALNAAVEAARAGQHGKGFAVVADEVRNLATKSAEAAKDTGVLIANSMEKAQLGAQIASDTAASLKEIVESVSRCVDIINVISSSSSEQAASVTVISSGISQVEQIVKQNNTTAEQSAAASEELSGISGVLQQLVAQFRLKDSQAKLPPAGMGTLNPRDSYYLNKY